MSHRLKSGLTSVLAVFYRVTAKLRQNLQRIHSHALLSSRLMTPLDASVVVMGPSEVHGTGNIYFGRNSLLYPDLYLETRGEGLIEIGNGVVLSRGVHLVSRSKITIGHGTMIGEYSSIRDGNHLRKPGLSIRHSGHTSKPINIGSEVWIGRGVTVLQGVTIGHGATIGANAVVTSDVPAGTTVVGIPARPIVRATVSAEHIESGAKASNH